MKNFQIVRASSPSSAVASSSKDAAKYIAGGTNLVDLMKKNVTDPDRLIDITGLDLKKVEQLDGKIRIGALATNSQVAEDKLIKEKYPLLSLALAAGASQQIRNMATIGGNMLQRTRCSYFYNTDMPCNKRQPKSGCGAKEGYNRMHAIFGASDSCIAVHPSDMCIALAALDATVVVEGSKGQRSIKFVDFHKLPGDTPEKDTTLKDNELIIAVELPVTTFSKNVHYLKVRDRTSYAFALVSVAVALDISGGTINEARLAMGGVAHKPWRVEAAERDMSRGAKALTAGVLANARTTHDNAFKVLLVERTIASVLNEAKA